MAPARCGLALALASLMACRAASPPADAAAAPRAPRTASAASFFYEGAPHPPAAAALRGGGRALQFQGAYADYFLCVLPHSAGGARTVTLARALSLSRVPACLHATPLACSRR